ncbi:hypothetical protein MCOR02_007798 [Pyricularia oryzae]|nr:hypothetical protein MCOR02_007798 [Pyricularia oryzae]KAI6505004.1 hypothetical protein MCOR13_004471 [Pyricularia oryzae]KAI6559973.1 hypothetical protein MCOR04_009764 [Pyricularia oryzae]
MTASIDTSPSADSTVAMAEITSPSATAADGVAAPAPANSEEPAASSITVNTKQPATTVSANFPPPKTDKPRPHVCTTCSRCFARLEHLKRHERSHTKEKPFECPECARCFARRDLLLRHQQKLHQTTTPASRPRNRRESASGVVAPGSRARKNSIASSTVSGVGGPATMRPRANTISHVDGAHMSMIAAANANVARGLPPNHHSRHPSLVGLPHHAMEHTYAGMASAMGQRGMAHGLPKLDTHAMAGFDPYGGGLRTAPPIAAPGFGEFDFESIQMFGQGSTINPNALHYNDSPPSMAMDPMSPFTHGIPDMSGHHHRMDDAATEWFGTFDHQLSFSNANEHAVDGSSPSAISTTSQSGLSDIMLDGSNQHPVVTSVAATTFYQPAIMGSAQMTNPFGLELHNPVFADMLTGAVSPQPPTLQKNGAAEQYFSTPPPSLNSLSPALMSSLGAQNMSHALNFGAGPETPSSMNGIKNNHGTSPVSTITDSTRNAILGALSCGASQHSLLGGSRYSYASSKAPSAADPEKLPSTQDLQRYVAAYIRYFHPHLPFLHVPTLSFEVPNTAGAAGGSRSAQGQFGGPGCLLMSMAAIGALYEMEHAQSANLFEMAKKMIQLYLDERRKATVRKADFRRLLPEANNQSADSTVETPVWLVQAMLINVIYGFNCGDKRSGNIASTHVAALVSLAQGAELPRPIRVEPRNNDTRMEGIEDESGKTEDFVEWLTWKSMEEKKRTLYVIFILSSMLVNAYNHTPALTNSEVLLDLPCDEEFFAAETAAAFNAKGGVAAANHNRMRFHDALGELLQAKARQQHQQQQQQPASEGCHRPFGSTLNPGELPQSQLKPSTFGCLILIDALHNYIWETRQRHHNKVWTNEDTEKMHRHIEPALRAWQAAWASNPQHSLERPNPYGAGPLSADAIPLLDLAYVRLFVNMSRTKEKFWERDWEGLAKELSRGSEIIQHAEHSPRSNSESAVTDQSDVSGGSAGFIDSPPTQSSSPDFAAGAQFSSAGNTKIPVQGQQGLQQATSRREKHLRKAAFYAADSLSMSDKLGVTFADFTSRELPLQSAMCALDCSQVLAEWVATLQDRVGRYLGILGQEDVDLGQVPAIMLLEDEDVKLLGKIQDVLNGAEIKMNLEAAGGKPDPGFMLRMGEQVGYAAKILHVTAFMLSKGGAWPITHLMANCLDQHANHMRARAERSIIACD